MDCMKRMNCVDHVGDPDPNRASYGRHHHLPTEGAGLLALLASCVILLLGLLGGINLTAWLGSQFAIAAPVLPVHLVHASLPSASPTLLTDESSPLMLADVPTITTTP